MVMAGIFRIEGVFSNTEWGIFELPPVFLFFKGENRQLRSRNMCSMLKYGTNRINDQCNSHKKKIWHRNIFENATARYYSNYFFHDFLHVSFQTLIVMSQLFVGINIAPFVYFLS